MKSYLPVFTYLILITGGLIFFSIQLIDVDLGKFENLRLVFSCMLLGGFGGVLYCLRGMYLSYCVKDNWSNRWVLWYIIRPLVSTMCGGISFLFLKAGLLVLEAQKNVDSSNLGFYAFALIAGLNVDNFLKKIEDIAETTWGIAKSRSSKNESEN
jgi:hypothetical protein